MSKPIDYPSRLPLARLPTPLEYLPRASERWGCGKRLWIKRDDLTGSALTGNKVRKLEFIAAHAIEQGFLTLVTCGSIHSNHCRATAIVAAQLGLGCHLVLRANNDENQENVTGNYLLDLLAGAKIDILPTDQWVAQLPLAFDRLEYFYAEAGRPALMIPTGGSDSLGLWGYIAAVEELANDLKVQEIDRSLIVTATGSGGTQTGLTAGVALMGLPTEVVGYAVCDDSSWFDNRVRSDWIGAVRRWKQLPRIDIHPVTRDHSVGEGYGKASKEVYRSILELARLEGVLLDPVYTGKAFLGLIKDIAAGEFPDVSDIVFIHTGGVFGLFNHQSGILEQVRN